MGRYRNYSDQDKAVALAYLASVRYNYQAASKHLGIPWQTLQHWHKGEYISDAVAEKEHKERDDFVGTLKEKIWLMLDEGFQVDKVRESPINALGSTIGTFIDRVQLLENKPTQIHGDDGSEKRIIIEYDNRTPQAPAPDAAPDAAPTDK